MLEILVAVVIVLLFLAGFYFTRGSGGIPGGVNDPATRFRDQYTGLGDRLPEPGVDPEVDREHQVE